MKNYLLCTFTTEDDVESCVINIQSFYKDTKIYSFRYKEAPTSIICTYNVTDISSKLKDTILINRKKLSNTLYSINGLNALIRSLNEGMLDMRFPIEWNKYCNTLILAGSLPNVCRFIQLEYIKN